MKYKPHPRIGEVLDRIRVHKEPYDVRFLDKTVIVFPNVLSPRYNPSSRFYVLNIPNQKGKEVLEIGCGSGVISLAIALQGAKKIVAVDINPDAIENTKENFKKHNIKNAKAFYSDVFDSVNGKYDSIIFDAPYFGNNPSDILECSVSDPDYKSLRLFMRDAKKYLKNKGKIYLGFSDTGDTELVNQLIEEYNYKIKEFFEEAFVDWKAYLYVLELAQSSNDKVGGFLKKVFKS